MNFNENNAALMKVEELLKSYEGEMIETLQRWIAIPSVMDEAADGAPFGKEVRRMLDVAMADCEKMGFDTLIAGGYAGHAEMGAGEDADALAILAHLDVVPVGDGWARDPFGGQVENGFIYGRGTNDDKGPAVAALYAMRAVKEAGIPLKKKVRLILGCNEECGGGEDLLEYAKYTTMPRSGFSPDAGYPVINIEKGGLHLILEGEMSKEGLQVKSLHAGTRPNVIPGYAEAIVYGDEKLIESVKKLDLGFETGAEAAGEGLVKVWSKGTLGHAAFPEAAKNAIGQLLILLRFLGVKGALADLADVIGTDAFGERLGIAMEDKLSGKLTASMDILDAEDGKVRAVVDTRTPLTAGHENLIRLAQMALRNMTVRCEGSREGHYVPADSELVQGLLKAYSAVTGEKGHTVAIGGGTYAHYMQEGVAFGAVFENEEDCAHQANEYMNIESLYKNMRIFARAILELAAE